VSFLNVRRRYWDVKEASDVPPLPLALVTVAFLNGYDSVRCQPPRQGAIIMLIERVTCRTCELKSFGGRLLIIRIIFPKELFTNDASILMT